MKEKEDILIDFAKWFNKKQKTKVDVIGYTDVMLYLKSINPQNEPDGHRRLEDNKDKKEICPFCRSTNIFSFELKHSKCKLCNERWTN